MDVKYVELWGREDGREGPSNRRHFPDLQRENKLYKFVSDKMIHPMCHLKSAQSAHTVDVMDIICSFSLELEGGKGHISSTPSQLRTSNTFQGFLVGTPVFPPSTIKVRIVDVLNNFLYL